MLINGEKWLDTNGDPIHAHGGYIINYGGYYYWYGEDRRENFYVSCYRSKDLREWEFMCHSLTTESLCQATRVKADLALKRPDGGKVNIERPKVLYNEETKKFVMWMHYENGVDYNSAACAVATSDTPDGEFTYHGSFNPYGCMSRDCTLFQDNGNTYFISTSRDNKDLHIYRLSSDYLNVDRHVNTLFQGELREAPAFFKKDGKIFCITSGCTGWSPNQSTYSFGTTMEDGFSVNRNFGDETTFRSQSAFVLPVGEGKDKKYIYFGDRWGGRGEKYFESSYICLEIKFDKDNMPYIEYSQEAYL